MKKYNEEDNDELKYIDDMAKRYMKSLKKYNVLSVEETKELLIKYYETKDEAIKNKIFEGNLRLVIYCLRNYHCNQYMEYMDLIQEGNMGLIEAIEKYDVNRYSSFTNFAFTYIKKYISRFIVENIRVEHVPEYKITSLYNYIKNKNRLSNILGRVPTLEEIQQSFNLSISKILEFEQMLNITISLNQKTEEGDEIGDFIHDPNSLKFIEDFEIKELKNSIIKCLDNLNETEKTVVILICSLNYDERMTYEKIAKYLYENKITSKKLSTSSIKNIYEKAIKKLRKPENIKELKDYVGINIYSSNNDKENIIMFSQNEKMYLENRLVAEIKDYLKIGNYKKARSLINILEFKDRGLYLKYKALIEKLENNYVSSIKHYEDLLNYSKDNINIFLELSTLYPKIGENEVNIRNLNSLLDNKINDYKIKIYLAYSYIVENNYYSAFKVLSSIDKNTLSINELYIYTNVLTYVTNVIRRQNKQTIYEDYLSHTISNHNKIGMLETLDYIYDNYKSKIFINDKDELKKMLMSLKNKIEQLEGNHMGFFDTYKITLDNPIGYIGGAITNDICVSTLLGNKRIIYAFPVLLSEEFENDRGENNGYYRK